MRERQDRKAVPLISWGGGIIVSPTIRLQCAYGDDGSSYRAPDAGCYHEFCSKDDVWRGGKDGHPCGFGSDVQRSWHPEDLDTMLRLYNRHSQPFKWPSFYSGYNELVYGHEEWNSHLPHTIEAFVGTGALAREQRRGFIDAYGLRDDEVPLLAFDANDWETPFRLA